MIYKFCHGACVAVSTVEPASAASVFVVLLGALPCLHPPSEVPVFLPSLYPLLLLLQPPFTCLPNGVQTLVLVFSPTPRLWQCYYFFRRANFCKKTGAFLAKIRALDGRKDGQNSSYVLKKRVNSTRDILTTKVRKSTQF